MTQQSPPWHYRAFGMNIRSDIELLEMRHRAADDADLVLVFGEIPRPYPPGLEGRDHEFGPDEQYMGFASVGKYLIRNGGHVTYDRFEGLPLEFVGFSFLGPVMATVLHVRGYLVLHGSALAVDGQAVVFLGDKGAGKSTTAGAMIAADHELVSDDVIAVMVNAQSIPKVEPAYPTIKVTETALASYGSDRFTIINTGIEGLPKQRARLHRDPPEHAVPIARIYILERGTAESDPEVIRLPSEAALPHLFEQSYMARYGKDAFQAPGAMTRHFAQCAELVRKVPVARLIVPGQIERLPEAVACVERDVRTDA